MLGYELVLGYEHGRASVSDPPPPVHAGLARLNPDRSGIQIPESSQFGYTRII